MIYVLTVAIYTDTNQKIPTKAYPHDAGYDIALTEDVEFDVNTIKPVSLGIHVNIPKGYMGLLVPRSSIYKHGVIFVNSVGIIDSGYTGPIHVLLHNILTTPVKLSAGMRLAQLIFVKIEYVTFNKKSSVEALGVTLRGDAGLGSTGD